MISATYVRRMARYNAWQNRSLYGVASELADADRRADRGAFFGSVHATLNHLLWGDQMWMSRFSPDVAAPGTGISGSTDLIADWADLRDARAAFDQTIETWASKLSADWLADELTWFSGAAGKTVTRPNWLLVTHFFNHQTHHRGQVHAMLTAAGARPDDTDLFLMAE